MADELGNEGEDHPEFLAMTAAVFSQQGRKLAKRAAAEGLPALAGVDGMLTMLFVRYRGKRDYTLKNAGYIVAKLMRDELGYTQGPVKKLPDDCTATTGTMFDPINSN